MSVRLYLIGVCNQVPYISPVIQLCQYQIAHLHCGFIGGSVCLGLGFLCMFVLAIDMHTCYALAIDILPRPFNHAPKHFGAIAVWKPM